MRYLSVCSGIEAASVAWHPLGWEPVAFSEIEKFPSAVLSHHYPDTPNYGDMTKYKEWPLEPGSIDLLVGGTPCQSFSVAGLRKGLDDPRGNLALVFLGIADRLRPRYVVWENVPGVLSSNGGRDFGAFLGALGELGYGWAYRVLDAQYVRTHSHPHAVPQRRRRVFVVGCLGDPARARAVLFEREGLRRNPPPRREAGKAASPTVTGGFPFSRTGNERVEAEAMVAHTLRGEGFNASEDGTGRGTPIVVSEAMVVQVANPLTARMHKGINTTVDEGQTPIVFDPAQVTSATNRSNPKLGDPCHPLAVGAHPPAVAYGINARQDPDVYKDRTGPIDTDAGTQAVAFPLDLRNAGRDPEKHDEVNRQGVGVGEDGEPSHTLSTACVHGVATYSTPAIGCIVEDDVSSTVTKNTGAGGETQNPAFVSEKVGAFHGVAQVQWSSGGGKVENDTAQTLRSGAEHNYQFARIGMAVRRLTPTECERLQGFPDGWTNVPWRKKDEAPDGPRYKALGNSMAVNVMRWIGERIAIVDSIKEGQ
jgi:DNA (cytosine-5)-methyltransferase 1